MPSPTRLLGTFDRTDQQTLIFGEDFEDALRLAETAPAVGTETCKQSLSQPELLDARSSELTPFVAQHTGSEQDFEQDLESAPSVHLEELAERISHKEKPEAVAMLMEADDGMYLVDLVAFRRCRWFTRGWTLQELLAPERIVLFSADWNVIPFELLKNEICVTTRIHKEALAKSRPIATFSVAQRMSWAAGRVTRRAEDRAYSLLGIFGVNLPVLYGEGNAAFSRLQEEIMRVWSNDQTIFVFDRGNEEQRKPALLLAQSPDQFHDSNDVVTMGRPAQNHFHVTNRDVTFNTLVQKNGHHGAPGTHLYLACTHENDDTKVIVLNVIKQTTLLARTLPNKPTREDSYFVEHYFEPMESIDLRYVVRRGRDVFRVSLSVLRAPDELRFYADGEDSMWPKSARNLLLCRFGFSKFQERTGLSSMFLSNKEYVDWSVVGTCSNGVWDGTRELFVLGDRDSKHPFTGQLKVSHKGSVIATINIKQRVFTGWIEEMWLDEKWGVSFDSPSISFPWWFLGGYSVQLSPKLPNRVIIARGMTHWRTPGSTVMPLICITDKESMIVPIEILYGIIQYAFCLLLAILFGLCWALLAAGPYAALGYGIYRLSRIVREQGGGPLYVALAVFSLVGLLIAYLLSPRLRGRWHYRVGPVVLTYVSKQYLWGDEKAF
ncbi:hypothetical protein CKM354_000030800 [Cercospora kikuchii]|uniref:Transmembrane protein n=1 Tax=Cercospora kikuchii TaxID=84275 RepID=A0A9P3F739_9PEZI|nr:uncharacterized protein CKM354_000030800 [Cercospora kikuchii]GIZ36841.1 hypothetical protein CKM354_000030800 [Cercospora kikuchii]